ncbi:MAG: cohesin domain-containing protein [Caldilineaceae bacterium]
MFNIQAVQADGEPTLSIPTTTQNVMNNSTFTVPNGSANAESNDISALSFSLDFDSTCLTFDSVTDGNTDGIPDAVTGLPSGYVTIVTYDGNDKINFTLNDQEQPQTELSDGVLVTFEFGVQSSCRTTDGTQPEVTFAFTSSTYGNVLGAAVIGLATDGTYTLRFDAYPIDAAMSQTAIDENVALGTTVGTFTSSS